ncbi:2-polyprenyl-3-methyl-5-hydroxy-6-metoxy-1,4-benzoquinol methylase [Catalinimonas alkaloidigena]|uniref:methyltransferase n=1 Tax=Catalinimonas alkaloidigena TaxID=1075417 RepID=UPI0024050196|nr:methyltransferase [Catalinimonas alkaloidigena]MDF9800586.1 2-polyprenyl-3-methyl-5-hydroxy-6-metoxy-1,4-benzoquinol methylase [Catalinimonas alkaloidigena]
MKLTSVPENLLERFALWLGIAPTPISDTHVAFMMARTIMVGAKLGIFEALAQQSATAKVISEYCQTHPNATLKILNALVHLGYLTINQQQEYRLTHLSRKWMLQDSEKSVYDKMMLQFVEWKLVEHYENYVRSGEPADMHRVLCDKEWEVYQRGMRSMAKVSAWEVAKRTPIPKRATHMLDVGGAHGYYSVALCQKYPDLKATILDLPEAIKYAKPLLSEENMDHKIKHQAGNVLTTHLGKEVYDVVFISSLVHHFDAETNIVLAQKVYEALKPGGRYIIQEYVRDDKARRGDHLAILDLYFAATSQSGTWSKKEMSEWQKKAGFKPYKTIWLRSIPRHAQVVGKKI